MEAAPDDVLCFFFIHISSDFSQIGQLSSEQVATFIWFRTTLPLVCRRWYRLLKSSRLCWKNIPIMPRAECAYIRRSTRLAEAAGSSPRAGASPAWASPYTPALGSSPASSMGASSLENLILRGNSAGMPRSQLLALRTCLYSTRSALMDTTSLMATNASAHTLVKLISSSCNCILQPASMAAPTAPGHSNVLLCQGSSMWQHDDA